MKKTIVILAAIFICVAATAQNDLKGNWSFSRSVMGVSITDLMSFDSDLSGNVEKQFNIDFDMDAMGLKMSGEIECSMKGTFELDDNRLTIKWDPETVTQKTLKPIECYYKGKPAPEEIKQKMEDMEKSITDSIKDINEVTVFELKIQKNKLILSDRNGDGKKNSMTYTRR